MQNQLGAFRTKYAGLPSPATNRTHCLAWNGYGSPAQMELANGIRLDTSYYYWPAAWVADRPGMHTGSGMPMRFAQSTGAIVDVYQAPTQMNDEAGQTYPATAVTLLDRALGAEGYYGAFTANMHTDTVSSPGSDAIVTAALARGVPIVAAQQMLTWLDGRNASSFGSLNWQTGLTGNPLGGSVLSFTIHVGAGANGLTATVPSQASTGKLTAITRDTTPVAFTVQTIKGVEYAVFPAVAGLYAVTYDSTAPETTITSNPPLLTNQTNGTFGFTATEAGATFECSIDAQPFAPCTSAAMVGGLGQGPHTFRVRGTDTAGNVDPTPASYTWTVDLTGPAVTTRTPAPGAAGVAFGTTVVAQFAEPLNASSVTTATFRLRASGSGTDVPAAVTYSGTTATLTPSATLALGTTYHVTLDASLVDLAGNTMGSDVTWSFTTINTVTDTLVADFGAGTADANVYLASAADGELMLTPAIGTEFTGGALPAGWAATAWNPGGAAVMGGGRVTVDGARLHPAGLVGAGRSLEFGATFSGAPFEHVGFGVTMNETPWAIFSTSGGGALWARTHNGASAINTPIPGAWLNVPHQYRIEWNATSVVFYIDGVQVASHATTIAAQMRPIITNYATGGGVIAVDYLRMSDYATPGSFTSRVFDARGVVNWTNAAWSAAVPAGTGVTVSVRFGATPTPDGTWTPFTAVGAGGAIGGNSRYVQYRIEMSTTSPAQTPSVGSITLTASTP
jgi:hypothetical protein